MATFTDREIVAGFKSGLRVEEITQFLYKRSFKSIKNLVFKKGGNKQDAEDLFHDVLIILIEIINIDRFKLEREATLATFLYAIAQRLWQKRQARGRKEEMWIQKFVDNQPLVEDMVGRLEDQLTAVQILERLPQPCQHILYSYYIEGCSLREIAEGLDSNEIAVRQQKFRCLKKLRELL